MLQLPALAVSLVLASTYAALFYLFQGRGWRHLMFYWLASVAGFACGQLAGERLHIIPWTVGQVHVIESTLGSLLFMLAANWLKPQAEQA